jgi:cyclic pyranopterin phosphate synthase
LYARRGHDLRGLLRGGATDQDIAERLVAQWGARADRGAVDRAALASRLPLVQIGELRRDPRLEMHTRGG